MTRRYWLLGTLQAGEGAIRGGKTINVPKGFTGFTYSCSTPPPPPPKVPSIKVEFYQAKLACSLPQPKKSAKIFTGPVNLFLPQWPEEVIAEWNCLEFITQFPEGC